MIHETFDKSLGRDTCEFNELVTIWPNAFSSKFDITDHNYTYVMMMGFSQNLAKWFERKQRKYFVSLLMCTRLYTEYLMIING